MKSYTDLEQSKKLVEILPLESADMVLLHEEPYETSDSKFDGLHQVLCVPFNKYDKSWRQKYKNISYFPCWSLSALLKYLSEIMPQVYTPVLFPSEDKWILQFVGYGHGNVCEVSYDNPIDACYETIVKLNELIKML